VDELRKRLGTVVNYRGKPQTRGGGEKLGKGRVFFGKKRSFRREAVK